MKKKINPSTAATLHHGKSNPNAHLQKMFKSILLYSSDKRDEEEKLPFPLQTAGTELAQVIVKPSPRRIA